MLCPKCGNIIEAGQRFCTSCGADISALMAAQQTHQAAQPQQAQQPQAQPQVQQYQAQPQAQQYQAQPQAQQYQAQPQAQQYQAQPQAQQYQAQPQAQQYQAQQYQAQPQAQQQPQQYQAQPQYQQTVQQPYAPVPVKKKKSKAPLIAVGAGAAAVLVIGGGIGGFLIYQTIAADKFIKENPTKAVANSYTTFVSSRKDPGTAGLFTLLNNAKDHGTLTVKLDGKFGYDESSLEQKYVFSYDKSKNEYYIMADHLDSLMKDMNGETDNSLIEFYTNVDKLNFNYKVADGDGSYYVDVKNFRSSMDKSIYSPNNGNVLNLTDEQYENFIKSVEQFYNKFSEGYDNASEEYIDKFVEILEKHGNPEVEEETITVRDKDRNVYTITYKLDRSSLKALVKDIKTEMLEIADKQYSDDEDYMESRQSLIESLDGIIDSLDNAPEDMKIVIKNCIDKGSKEIALLEVTATNYDTAGSGHKTELSVEFDNEDELDIYAEVVVKADSTSKMTLTLTSEKDGSKTIYAAKLTSRSGSQKENRMSLELEYNDSAKTYELSYTVDGEKKTIADGKADISPSKALFTYEFPYNDHNIEVSVELTDEVQINRFDGQKDFLALTKEDIEELSSGLGSSAGNIGSGGILTSANQSKKLSDAASIDNACKTYYAGIVAGMITYEDDYSELLNTYDDLPGKGATASERKRMALEATIGGALDYNGMYDTLAYDLSEFGADAEGNIYYINDPANSSKIVVKNLSVNTTLSELYNQQ